MSLQVNSNGSIGRRWPTGSPRPLMPPARKLFLQADFQQSCWKPGFSLPG